METKIKEITLSGLKSVKNGKVEFLSSKNNKKFDKKDIEDELNENFENKLPDILGFYGQNGSGKSSMIDSASILKVLFSGNALSSNVCDYINVETKKLIIKIKFAISFNELLFDVEYEVTIEAKKDNNGVFVSKESISYNKKQTEMLLQSKMSLNYDYNGSVNSFISPKTRMDSIIGENKDNLIELNVIKNECYSNSQSFLFNKKFIPFIKNDDSDFRVILGWINFYSLFQMMVINNKDFGQINMDQLLHIPFAGKNDRIIEENNIKDDYFAGDWYIKLFESGSIKKEYFDPFNKVIEQINLVMQSFIPDLQIDCFWNDALDEKGNEIKKYEFISVREGKRFPLRCESDGIKKLISICCGLISYYNNPSFFLAIDELDSGIFEYLLGDIIEVLKRGKGQFIFTSHNLHPLEVLSTKNIILTTTDANERYIPFISIHPSNNARDTYIRYIYMGDYKKSLYLPTNTAELSHALKKAGKIKIK